MSSQEYVRSSLALYREVNHIHKHEEENLSYQLAISRYIPALLSILRNSESLLIESIIKFFYSFMKLFHTPFICNPSKWLCSPGLSLAYVEHSSLLEDFFLTHPLLVAVFLAF